MLKRYIKRGFIYQKGDHDRIVNDIVKMFVDDKSKQYIYKHLEQNGITGEQEVSIVITAHHIFQNMERKKRKQ